MYLRREREVKKKERYHRKENVIPTMNHYPSKGQEGDSDPLFRVLFYPT